jgi:hypothetical protein
MSTITIGAPRQYIDHGWSAVASRIQVGDKQIELYFRCSQGPLTSSCTPFALSMLLPALKLGASVTAATPLLPQLLATMDRLQRMIIADTPALQQPVLIGPVADNNGTPLPTAQPDGRGAFLFFSGGVDSFHTLLEHHQDISHCVFVHGFDTLLADARVAARNVSAMRQAAAELGKPLIEIETNYRSCVDRLMPWNHHSATIAQCALASALSPQFSRGYVAQNYDYLGVMLRHGRDSNYDCGDVQVVQDGMDCRRLDKTIRIATSETAMRWLRVCWQNKQQAYNCGRCEKCLRTMIALHIAGALARCRTFDRPIDLERLRYLDFGDPAYFWPELVAELERRPSDATLAAAVRESIGWAALRPWMKRDARDTEMQHRQPELWRVVRERMEFAQASADPRQQAEQMCKAMTRVIDLQDELTVIKASRSWKLTAPLRALGRRRRGR